MSLTTSIPGERTTTDAVAVGAEVTVKNSRTDAIPHRRHASRTTEHFAGIYMCGTAPATRGLYLSLVARLQVHSLTSKVGAVSPVWTAGFGHVAGALNFDTGICMSNHWIEEWLGAPRFKKYVDTCQGDRSQALDLYEWNVTLGQALMRDIAHFEIALRNAYNSAFTLNWQGRDHWLLDAESPAVMPLWRIKRDKSGLKRGSDVNFLNRKSVDNAIRKCGGVKATPGHVIAELSFGFWSNLTSAANEKSIWVPYLHHAYPRGTNRGAVDKSISAINKVRNRIAHHEPIFDRQRTPELDPGVVSKTLLTTLAFLNQDAASHVSGTSRVVEVLGQRP